MSGYHHEEPALGSARDLEASSCKKSGSCRRQNERAVRDEEQIQADDKHKDPERNSHSPSSRRDVTSRKVCRPRNRIASADAGEKSREAVRVAEALWPATLPPDWEGT